MTWMEAYPAHRQPDMEQIGRYIASPCWQPLLAWLEDTFHISPRIEYSRCSMQGGWNVKYKKGSRAVCTLYPEEGYFICMISVGAKEAPEAELALNGCTAYVRQFLKSSLDRPLPPWRTRGEVRNGEVLEDVKELIGIRMRKKRSV